MAHVKLVVYDDMGTELGTHTYNLSNNLVHLDALEVAVESLRPTLLSDLTHDLLSAAQDRDEKKKSAAEVINGFLSKP